MRGSARSTAVVALLVGAVTLWAPRARAVSRHDFADEYGGAFGRPTVDAWFFPILGPLEAALVGVALLALLWPSPTGSPRWVAVLVSSALALLAIANVAVPGAGAIDFTPQWGAFVALVAAFVALGSAAVSAREAPVPGRSVAARIGGTSVVVGLLAGAAALAVQAGVVRGAHGTAEAPPWYPVSGDATVETANWLFAAALPWSVGLAIVVAVRRRGVGVLVVAVELLAATATIAWVLAGGG